MFPILVKYGLIHNSILGLCQIQSSGHKSGGGPKGRKEVRFRGWTRGPMEVTKRGLRRTLVQDVCVTPLSVSCPQRSKDIEARVLGEGRL